MLVLLSLCPLLLLLLCMSHVPKYDSVPFHQDNMYVHCSTRISRQQFQYPFSPSGLHQQDELPLTTFPYRRASLRSPFIFFWFITSCLYSWLVGGVAYWKSIYSKHNANTNVIDHNIKENVLSTMINTKELFLYYDQCLYVSLRLLIIQKTSCSPNNCQD